MANLTVIIAIKNEGDQLRQTLKSLRSTQDQDVDVLVINDASNDKYDYDALCKEFDSRIITNKVNLGTGPSKHLGTQNINTKNFILIDGHMRFRNDKWVSKIDKAINDNPKSVLCTGCSYLDDKKLKNELTTQKLIDANLHKHGWRGASIVAEQGYKGMWLPGTYWDTIEPIGTHQIPTIMGASYCSNLDWYNHIGGMEQLLAWGKEEEFLSWKSWRFGGDARVILDVWIGHIWKTRGGGISFKDGEVKANVYITAMITLPQEHLEKAMEQIHKMDGGKKGWKVVKKVLKSIEAEAARVKAADPDGKNFDKILACCELLTNTTITDVKKAVVVIPPTSPNASLGISIVIPLIDKYPENIKELFDKAGCNIEVILAHDGTSREFRGFAERDGCKYVRHEVPKGIAKCIESGMAMATGTVFCYLPSDFKVIKNNWAIGIYDTVIKTPRVLYGIGCTIIDLELTDPQRYFSPELDLKTYPVNHEAIVPSIPNTGFAIHKSYFRKLRRLDLLKGSEMIGLHLSIKVWRDGGVVKSIRERYLQVTESNGYSRDLKMYDKLLTILTLIPESEMEEFLKPLAEVSGFEEAMGLIEINSEEIDDLSTKMKATLTRTCQSLSKANSVFRRVYKND